MEDDKLREHSWDQTGADAWNNYLGWLMCSKSPFHLPLAVHTVPLSHPRHVPCSCSMGSPSLAFVACSESSLALSPAMQHGHPAPHCTPSLGPLSLCCPVGAGSRSWRRKREPKESSRDWGVAVMQEPEGDTPTLLEATYALHPVRWAALP